VLQDVDALDSVVLGWRRKACGYARGKQVDPQWGAPKGDRCVDGE
jgi:hypothetical protein